MRNETPLQEETKNTPVEMGQTAVSNVCNSTGVSFSPIEGKEHSFLMNVIPKNGLTEFETAAKVLLLATGSNDSKYANLLFMDCFNASGTSSIKSKEVLSNRMEAIFNALTALHPSDEIEGMLITRMIAMHFQIMDSLNISSNLESSLKAREMYSNRFTKLSRLYNETLESLMRYRRRGEQKVTVTHQHVNVGNGGQAVVGNNVFAGDVNKNKGDSPCSESAELKQEPITINHADSQQWQTEDVGCMEENQQDRKRKRGASDR